jgi:2-(1,2-epoxy-1,2-dihydrophenyl)acetyl-CoA isomerase
VIASGREPQRHVSYERRGDAAWITLDEPARGNPLHSASVGELLTVVRRANTEHTRVIVLAARGRFFSVGGDLAALAGAEDLGRYVDDLAESLHRVISELTRSDAVVVSVVQGVAAGAGFALAAAADIVLAAATSSFTLGYTAVGLSNDGGSSLLVHTLGLHRVLRLALLNDPLSAQEAHDAGLVARVVPDDELPGAAEQVVTSLLAGSPSAQGRAKRLIRDTAEPAPESVMQRETLSIRESAETDGREGINAFLDKRTPEFPGRSATARGHQSAQRR